MRKTIIICVLVISLNMVLSVYSQDKLWGNMHEYITYQAWQLVKAQHSEVIGSEIDQYIGTLGNAVDGTVLKGSGSLEDEDEIIYHLACNDAGYTCTHFWDADDPTNNHWHPLVCPYDYSIVKLKYIFSGYNAAASEDVYWLGSPFLDIHVNENPLPVALNIYFWDINTALSHPEYINCDAYKYYDPNLPPIYFSQISLLNFFMYNTSITQEEALIAIRKFLYEAVGRMCHLIEDNSVPAHTHLDRHPGSDYYEDIWLNSGSPQNYLGVSYVDALQQGGLIDVNTCVTDPLRALMYTTNQIADRFPSDDAP
ncbi:MAG: hypothetical protein LWX07_00960 [Bacteroidetes bacterium]|nr:hypothetical protein [Bacteroidota bacterium]